MKAWIFASAASFSLIKSLLSSVGKEIVGVDGVEFRIDAVDAADALNETCRIPRDVIIKDNVRAMKVDAF